MHHTEFPEFVYKTLQHLYISEPIFLGKGGEGYVFAYTQDTVIKIYKSATQEHLLSLQTLLNTIDNKNISVSTSKIEDIGKYANHFYTIEKRLAGTTMDTLFPKLTSQEKFTVLRNYYEALIQLHTIEMADYDFGNIVSSQEQIIDDTWSGFLIKKLEQRMNQADSKFRNDVINLDEKLLTYKRIISNELHIDKKYLVHADYYANQVLVDDNLKISAILDISSHAVAGDPRLDFAHTVLFLGRKDFHHEHIDFLNKLAIQDFGEELEKYLEIYQIYYYLYFWDIYKFNIPTYEAFVHSLNAHSIFSSS